MVKAIETVYNCYRFRSRLEARWAVFFDAMGIEYAYEPEGYEYFDAHGNQMRWLPDFRLNSEAGLLVEVKGSDESLQNDWFRLASAVERGNTPASEGLIILGDIPNPDDIGFGKIPVFSYLQRDFEDEPCGPELTLVDYATFFPFKVYTSTSCTDDIQPSKYMKSYVIRGVKNIRDIVYKIGDSEENFIQRGMNFHGIEGLEDSVEDIEFNHVTTRARIAELRSYKLDRLKAAYKVARQARFEHGETPKAGKIS